MSRTLELGVTQRRELVLAVLRVLSEIGEERRAARYVAELERAVAAALRDAVGPADARVLEQQLLTRYAAPLVMPRSQAMLLALRETLPLVADTVLQRSRNLYGATGESE